MRSPKVVLALALLPLVVAGSAAGTDRPRHPSQAGVPTISISTPRVLEGDSGVTPVEVKLRLSRALTGTTTVRYSTADHSARAPGDYTSASGIATFDPGTRRTDIELSVSGDILGERTEAFRFNLSQPSAGVKLEEASAFVTIENDDDRIAPVVDRRPNQTVETAIVPVVVTYGAPRARDNLDGATRVVCKARSGSSFRFGQTTVTCSSADRNGNVGTSTFELLVRRPTTAGGVTDPGGAPLTQVSPGQSIRVTAGGFAPGSLLTLFWTTSNGSTIPYGRARAGADGRIEAPLRVDSRTPLGRGQLTAQGVHTSRVPFARAWPLPVVAP
jgi:hypothetical protein